MAKVKVNSEVASAAMIHAMLTGESISSASKKVEVDIDVDEVVNDDMEDDYEDKEVINGIEIDIDDEGKSKSKKKTKKAATKKVKKTDEEIAAEKAAADRLPDCEYAELKKSEKFIVVLNQHEIPYKEQRWNIDERQVVYEVYRVDSKMSAGRVVRAIYSGDKVKEELEKAYSGENRYYEIRVFTEVVPTRVTTLGYIKVTPNAKENCIKLNRKDLEAHHISYDEVLKDVRKVIKVLIKY